MPTMGPRGPPRRAPGMAPARSTRRRRQAPLPGRRVSGQGGAGAGGSTTRAARRRWGPPRASGRGDQARRDQPLQGAGLVAAVDVLDQGQGAASRVRLEVMPGAARRVHRLRAVRAVAPFGIRGAWRIPEQAPGHVGQQGREVGAAHRGAVSSGRRVTACSTAPPGLRRRGPAARHWRAGRRRRGGRRRPHIL